MRKQYIFVLACLLFPFSLSFSDDCFDHEVWEKIVTANVGEDGYVDYAGVRINKGGGNLYEYLTFTEMASIGKCAPLEKTAFWINAYNANVFRILTESGKMDALSQTDAVFSTKFYAANERLTLEKLEDRILRADKEKGGPLPGLSLSEFDPRIHFAIADGTVGAPKLHNKAYDGKHVEEQLGNAAKTYVNDPKYIRLEGGVLVMNDLFRRHANDFGSVGDLVGFLEKTLDPALREDTAQIKEKLKTDFPDKVDFRYDWTVNALKNKK